MKRTVIRAYHQVGGDDRRPQDRRRYMDRILADGSITPAVDRIRRSEMEAECFGDAQGSQDVASFTGASAEARAALTQMAQEKIAQLPRVGSTHTMFNCLDLIAGDFDMVFLAIGDWYTYASGFVFDAEELLMSGALYRPADLLGFYRFKLEEAASLTYDSVEDARWEFEAIISNVKEDRQSTGKEAVTLLRNDCGKSCPGEIVWPGSLPLGLAIEMWREGRKVKWQQGAQV